ncbi:hypothetical protein AVEN_192105-1 [Araneus ventricosus]|uniref:Uncharacterized protein n=1 Tax=Araneus ventricosus TaxID=182803 RepID=A0A4Y2B7G4_ARAVE|nr:hypothetical protein AVEN_192105-1 [Araneus ventricosus]
MRPKLCHQATAILAVMSPAGVHLSPKDLTCTHSTHSAGLWWNRNWFLRPYGPKDKILPPIHLGLAVISSSSKKLIFMYSPQTELRFVNFHCIMKNISEETQNYI